MDYLWLILPLLITTTILLIIGGYSLHFHAVPAARPFTVVMFLGAAWAFTYALGIVSPSLADKTLLLKIRISLQLFIPLAMFVIALEQARLMKRIKNWQWLGLLIVPFVTLFIIWNADLFSLIFYDLHIDTHSPVLQTSLGPWIWVFAGNIAVIEVGMLLVFGHALKHSRGIYFRQTFSLALALIIPEAVYLFVGVLRLGPDSNNIAPNSFLLTGLLSAWALFRYQWLNLAPRARSLAVNDMNDAMLVLDLDDCIVDYNQAAAKFFAISEHNIGQSIKKALPQWTQPPYPSDETPLLSEFELNLKGEKHYFEVLINKIEDQHKHKMGQVVILREFTQRRKTDNELNKRLKELEVINAISVSVSSQLEMNNLIPLIGQKLEEIFNVQSVFVALYNPETKIIKMPYWTVNHERVQAAPIKIGTTLTSMIIKSNKPMLIPQKFEETAQKLGATLRYVDQYNSPKTWLAVPVAVGEACIGVLGVQDYENEHAFNEDDMRLLQTIAANLGIAIQNAHLYQEARHRAEQMSTLYGVGVTLTANLEFDQVIRQLFASCRQILPMDAFYVAVYDEKSHIISHPLYYENATEHNVPDRDITVSPGLSGEIILNGKTIYLPDASKRQTRQKHQVIQTGGKPARSYVGAPMTVSGRVMGVLSMQSYAPNAYTDEQIRLLETVANVAGVAIENSRLYGQAQADIEQRRNAQEALQHVNQDLHIQLNKVKALQRELREQATRDPLTGLHNRRYLGTALPHRIAQSAERHTPLSIVMIDIDRFKTFNDSYGHQAGDAMLQALAALLRQHTRSMDIACRYGGEEFLLALSNTSLEVAARRAEELRRAFDIAENKFGNQILHATISVGVAAFPDHGTGIEELIMQADQALYAAKAAGRNQVVVWRK